MTRKSNDAVRGRGRTGLASSIGLVIFPCMLLAQDARAEKVISLPDGGDGPSIGTWNSATKTLTLTADVSETIRIAGDGITLDGNGHTVSGHSTAGGVGYGILLSQVTGVTVRNCVVRSSEWGLFVLLSHNTVVRGNDVVRMGLEGSGGSIIENNVVRAQAGSAWSGLYIRWSAGVRCENNTILGTLWLWSSNAGSYTANQITGGVGIIDDGCHGSTFTRNRIVNCFHAGIQWGLSSDCLFYDNLFRNNTNVELIERDYLPDPLLSNAWSVPKRLGTNILGGDYVSGNAWLKPDGTGASQSRRDLDGDGLCDRAYEVLENNVDQHPLYSNVAPSCSASGAGTYQCGVDPVVVGGTVSDGNGDTITYSWRDSGGHVLQGRDTSGNIVWLSGSVIAAEGGDPTPIPAYEVTNLSAGTHTLILGVSDGERNAESEIQVQIIDTTAPTLAPVASPGILWPPNNETHAVSIQVNASDNCGSIAPVIGVSQIVSDQAPSPSDATTPDIAAPVIDQANGVVWLRLRAHRYASQGDRHYFVTITATDASGNRSQTTIAICVPRSQGQGGD